MTTKHASIVGIFVRKKKILSFMETLINDFKIHTERIFIYSIDSNTNEFLVTIKTFNKDSLVKRLKGSKVIHIKNGCLFSINALNKLIEIEKNASNTPNNEFLVDWDKYKDKLIITSNGELSISNITKIEDKSSFFKQEDIYNK